jgi:hypothetical protein
MPDQHKLTREEHRVAVVKFTQELTDTQPANAGSDCGSTTSSSSAASSVKAVSGGDVMSDDESGGLCAPTHGGIDWRC